MAARAERHAPRFFSVPKPGGTRLLTELDVADLAEYRIVTGRVAEAIDRRLVPDVMADRLRRDFGRGHSLGEPWYEPWIEARRRLRRETVKRTKGAIVIRTDVRDCFGSIGTGVVEAALLRLGCHPSEVGAITRILDRFDRQGVRGLPVGPGPSAILASAVLARADEAFAAEGTTHLRWVDDFVAFARTERQAVRILERLSEALDELGLRLADEKTGIGGSPLESARESPPAGG